MGVISSDAMALTFCDDTEVSVAGFFFVEVFVAEVSATGVSFVEVFVAKDFDAEVFVANDFDAGDFVSEGFVAVGFAAVGFDAGDFVAEDSVSEEFISGDFLPAFAALNSGTFCEIKETTRKRLIYEKLFNLQYLG